MDRFPFVRLFKEYLDAKSGSLGASTLDVRRRNLQLAFQVLLEAKSERRIGTLDPRRFGPEEIRALKAWTDTKKSGYAAKLWTAIASFLLYCDNGILERMEAHSEWTRPDPVYIRGPVKDEAWLKDVLAKLDALGGWRAEVVKFSVAFIFGTGLRAGELRQADLADLDTQAWAFKVQHPKKVKGAQVGAELAVYSDTHVHVLDFLAARERHLRELGFDPAKVTALIPSDLGRHYTETGFRMARIKAFAAAGVEGDFQGLRRTHEQVLMDRLERQGYKEGSVVEIAAKRLRHSYQTAVKHYADLRTERGQKAAQEAWEAPAVVSEASDG